MMTFKDCVHKCNLKTRATSNMKIQRVFLSLSMNDAGIYLRDEPFLGEGGVVNLHPSKGTHWIC